MSGFIRSGRELTANLDEACDVCIVGSGAGGAVLAARLAARGLDVVMLEEGRHFTRDDFTLDEADAYPTLYQGAGAWATDDLAITILQGRTVGGSTTVNWTTSYRTPERILERWRQRGIDTLDAATLNPHWDSVEQRLNIHEWPVEAINANNGILHRGCQKLGWDVHPLRRNVRGCMNSGYCGLGCPVDAKQAMHVTYLPDAVRDGLRLYAEVQVERVEHRNRRVEAIHGVVLDGAGQRTVVVRPKVAVLSAGAIGSPSVMLRSELDFDGRVGKRTWLHPVVALPALFNEEINGFHGAPQTVASHQFIDRGEGRIGYFLEVPPVQPMLVSTASTLFGADQQAFMAQLPHLGILIGIAADGLLDTEEGGTVTLRKDGRPKVHYPIGPELREAFGDALRNMARVALAAGARSAYLLHCRTPAELRSEADIEALRDVEFGPLLHPIFTAHVMGGCAMGPDAVDSVVDPHLRHHHVPNLFVVDGSVLPTSLGVNPSETIYAIASWAADAVAAAV